MCVMELCSLLTGSHFSDDPEDVCPVIAAFLRGYNDQLPDRVRQGVLLRWASDAAGTRSESERVVAERAAAIERFVRENLEWWRPRGAYRGKEQWRLEYLGGRVGQWAGHRPARHAAVDALLEQCVAAGAGERLRQARVAAGFASVTPSPATVSTT